MKKQKRKKTEFENFSAYHDYQKLRREVAVSGLFLCLLCAVLAAVFFVRGLANVGAAEILNYCFSAFFAGIILLYVLFPAAPFRLLEKLRPVTNAVGKYVLRAILVPVYGLTCLFSLPFIKKQQKKYRFAAWDEAAPPEDSYFSADTQNVFRQSSAGSFRFLSGLLGAMAEKRQFFLFPVLLILLLLGLFFYFISSSSILGFIYTLF